MSKEFISGLELSEKFYQDVVKEKIESEYPNLDYAAALIGKGSEVLGFDDKMSTDHHWGPRLYLFLRDDDYQTFNFEIKQYLSYNLPTSFLGYSTNWSEPDPNDSMNQFLIRKDKHPINHRIKIFTVKSYLLELLNIRTLELNEIDWLTIPEQILLEFTSGEVFYDSYEELTNARKILKYYPESLWMFKILSQCDRISQEMVLVGRTGGMGDDLGSMIEASRLVRYIMEMAFILEKKYIPYQKWFSKAFNGLNISMSLKPILLSILRETNWKEREKYLCEAYLKLIDKINQLKIIPNIDVSSVNFFNRPQIIVPFDTVMRELEKQQKNILKDLKYPIGSINQFVDNCNILSDTRYSKNAKIFFQ